MKKKYTTFITKDGNAVIRDNLTREEKLEFLNEDSYYYDIFIDDDDYICRLFIAKQGYKLDCFEEDESWQVRYELVNQGYKLEVFIQDYDPVVRNFAAYKTLELIRNILEKQV